MRYFGTASTERVRDAMRAGLLGQIVTPAAGNRLEPGVEWVADNAVFAGRYPGNPAYLTWLGGFVDHAHRCRFVVAPDVVGDAEATWVRSAPMLAPIQVMGFPVAYVAQNGATPDALPWHLFDVVFVGGDTLWKLGPVARAIADEARVRGVPVHMGRVNSLRRLAYAASPVSSGGGGCDSADGTYLAFGPDRNLIRLLGWLREVHHPALWEAP